MTFVIQHYRTNFASKYNIHELYSGHRACSYNNLASAHHSDNHSNITNLILRKEPIKERSTRKWCHSNANITIRIFGLRDLITLIGLAITRDDISGEEIAIPQSDCLGTRAIITLPPFICRPRRRIISSQDSSRSDCLFYWRIQQKMFFTCFVYFFPLFSAFL